MTNLKQRFRAAKLQEELSIKDGIVAVDNSSCDGCSSCVEVCPQSAIEIITLSVEQIKKLPFKGRLKAMIKGNNKAYINPEQCTSCGLCMKQCHEFAIHKKAN